MGLKITQLVVFATVALFAAAAQGFIVTDYFANLNARLPADRNFANHPCRRDCQQREPMECHYQMVVHYREVLGPECQDCLYDASACKAEECIFADGIPNVVMTVNNEWPAPPIEVCENDIIIADVLNLLDENTTMHWHGMHMMHTKDMDGAPYITQEPIAPGGSFRYRFPVDRLGTVWYHSHMFWQRALGIAGPLVIRQPRELNPFSDLYDYDLIEHNLIITDMVYNNQFNTPRNILINGKGRNHLNSWPDNDDRHRYERLTVQAGKRYLMRIVSNGVSNCPLEVTIENHNMLVIATDGNYMEPMLTDSFFLTSAERLDFIIEANQKPDNYWIRVRGHFDCGTQSLYQGAILHYEETVTSPEGNPITNMANMDGTSLTRVNVLSEFRIKPIGRAIQIGEVATVGLRSFNAVPWTAATKFEKFYTSFGMLRASGATYMQVDDITFAYPAKPLLHDNDVQPRDLCNRSNFTEAAIDCTTRNCECTNVIKIPAQKPIELIVVNLMNSTHPFHLHGYTFRLVGQAAVGNATALRNIRDMDQRGQLQRIPSTVPAIEKDTVQIPPLGYIILRFISDNTGYWLFHCHIERHAIMGMAGVIHVHE